MKIINSCQINGISINNRVSNYGQKASPFAIMNNPKKSVPLCYHRAMFEASQGISKVGFAGSLTEPEMQQLKKVLKQICEESIDRYGKHEIHLSENLFTRGFIQHSFDFVENEGDKFHNLKDPFYRDNWYFHVHMKNRVTEKHLTLGQECAEKMQKGIEGWSEKFIQIISKEKIEGKNNLLDELLHNSDDIKRIKHILGIN